VITKPVFGIAVPQPRRANLGYCYVHSAIDAYSRLADSEALDDETAATALAFRARARMFFAQHGTGERVLTDDSAYRSHAWRDAMSISKITHSRTSVRRPQTRGKVERLNRTLLEEWAYKRLYTSEKARRAAPLKHGCTTTTTTGPTSQSATSHRSAAAPTPPSSTTRRRSCPDWLDTRTQGLDTELRETRRGSVGPRFRRGSRCRW